MTEKVKLPHEVAEAIEGVRKHAHEDLLFNFGYIKDVCEEDKFDAPKFQAIYNFVVSVGFKKYYTALVNGYEVEQTPEDKVKNHYNQLIKDIEETHPENRNRDYFNGQIRGITRTLDLLGIKIEGVNT